jgi:hypothetical protein
MLSAITIWVVRSSRGVYESKKRPRQELNLRAWFRRPVLYPLSYGDFIRNNTILVNNAQNWWKAGRVGRQ